MFLTEGGSPRKSNFHVEFTKSRTWYRDVYLNGVYQNTQNLGLKLVDALFDSYFGMDLPNFHQRKRQGELLPLTRYVKATSNVKFVGTHTTSIPGGYTYVTRDEHGNRGPFCPLSGTNGFPFIWPIANHVANFFTSNGINTVAEVQKAASQLYSKNWDALTFLAEFHKAVDLFKQSAQRIFSLLEKGIEALPRTDSSISLARLWTLPFKEWLQYRYGWRILAYDIEDMSEALSNLGEKQNDIIREASGFNREVRNDFTRVYDFSSSVDTYSLLESGTVEIRGLVIADFTRNPIRLNPVTTAWELMTLSFVVDWFLDIGTSLEAMSLSLLSSSYTSGWGVHYASSVTGSRSSSWKPGCSGATVQTIEQTIDWIERKPVPVPYFPSNLVNKVDPPKVLDLISLLVGRVYSLIFRR